MVLFTLDKVPSPAKARPPPTLPLLERNRKVLKVGDLVVEEGPRPPAARRLPSTGDILLALYKCTDDARIWVDVKNPDMGLWQVQVKHDTRDSVCYQIQGIVFFVLPPGSTREVGGLTPKQNRMQTSSTHSCRSAQTARRTPSSCRERLRLFNTPPFQDHKARICVMSTQPGFDQACGDGRQRPGYSGRVRSVAPGLLRRRPRRSVVAQLALPA